MQLIDLMEIYRITANKPTVNDFIIDILNDADVDERIDRALLAMRILAECGDRLVRYNTTNTFKTFAVAWFEAHNTSITKTIDLLNIQYNPLTEYAEEKNEDIDRDHQTNGSKSSTLNATNGDNSTDEALVSAENESGVQLRNRDTHAETITKSETNATTRTEDTTHDDNILTTVSGHKTAPAELIRAELEKAKLNIYDQIICDFADEMFLNVF